MAASASLPWQPGGHYILQPLIALFVCLFIYLFIYSFIIYFLIFQSRISETAGNRELSRN